MKNNNYIPPKYKQFSPRMKKITRWQAIRLKKMGYKNIYISTVLGIHSSTVASWYKTTPINNNIASSDIEAETSLFDNFGKLQAEETKILSHYAGLLIENGVKRFEVAEILGLSSGAVISGWMNKEKVVNQENKSNLANKKTITQLTRRQVFNKFTKRMKDIVHWQICHLHDKGYDISFISSLLNINKSIISKDLDSFLKNSRKITYSPCETISIKFGKLSIKEKQMLLSQVAFLEKTGLRRTEIAKIIGLSSGAIISGWHKKNSKSNFENDRQEVHLPYEAVYQNLKLLEFRHYKKETKDLIRWQALLLKAKGYKYSEVSAILNIHASTISRWWKDYLKSGSKPQINRNSKIKKHFKKLTPEMKRVLSLQILKLKGKKYTHEEIATILALNNAALITRWLNNISIFTETHLKLPIDQSPINLPKIGFTSSSKNLKDITEENKAFSNLNKPALEVNKNTTTSRLSSELLINDNNNHSYFSKNGKANTIELKSNTKIIKAEEYSQYYNAEKLIEASKINLLESKKRAKKIIVKAEKSAEIITRKIIKQAEKKALKKAGELLAEKNIATTNSATKYLNTLQEKLPDIILAIINKFIEDYDDKDFIIHTINSAISEISNKEKVKIYVNNKVLDDVKKRLHKVKYPNGKITLISDTTIKKKDCLVVTKLGVVNANLESQIKKLEKNLRATCSF